MRVTVLRPSDLGPGEADRWHKFQHQSPVMRSPFLSLTFAQAVGEARANARVAVVENCGRIEAFLPYEIGPGRIGLPIGYPMNDLQGFIGSGAPLDARQIIRKAGLAGWRFIATPAEQTALARHQYEGTAVRCPVIDTSDGYQAYYASRSRSVTTKPARKRRALERLRGPVTLVWNSRSLEHVGQMISWKSAKYAGSHKLFSDPTARAIAESLSFSASDDCSGAVSVLLADGQPFAISCNLTGPGSVNGWFTSYDPELAHFSPGTILTFAIAEEAARRTLCWFDLGPGQDSYKFRLANQSYPVVGGAVWAHPAQAAARRLYRRLRG
jgi:CelD/BcsL family acetyltransferase involved in cellulose biosynthesis